MSNAQKSALTKLWPIYGLNLPNHPLDFTQIFQKEGPIILEIGFGNGDTLVTLAKAYPEKNFIGIDVHKPGIGALLLKLEKFHLTNVKVFCADAIDVISSIPNESLSAVYLLFPDPWPKRKHHKRRIIQPEFVECIQKKLAIGGEFHLATDWEDYAHQIFDIVLQNPHLKLQGFPSLEEKQRPVTKFEIRGEKLGHSIWDFIFYKQ